MPTELQYGSVIGWYDTQTRKKITVFIHGNYRYMATTDTWQLQIHGNYSITKMTLT